MVSTVSLTALLLPIVVSAVLVFVVSSLLHMLLTYHKADYKPLPREAEVAAEMGKGAPAPGLYTIPYCASHDELKKPEVIERFKRGPVAQITVLPSGPPEIGKYLAQWFAFSLVVSVCAAYLTGRTLGADAPYLQVFRVSGTAAFLAYGVGQISDSIWKGQPWANTARSLFDGLVYALVTGGAFGWLWPR